MQLEWSVIPRNDVRPADTRVYVTLNRKGEIIMNGTAYRRAGEPAAFLVMYNKPNSLIALKPTALAMRDAYPVRKQGRRCHVIRVLRLLNDHNIKLPDTIEFRDADVDMDGILILDLRTARVSPRAHSQCRKQ